MSQQGKSWENVHYEFRPAKQVERRMLIHAFTALMEAGFPISKYKYTGLGSIYFIDFAMFHRYLGINQFLSVESNMSIPKRVKFNRPSSCIEVAMGDIADFIPNLSPYSQHILWLDFDGLLTKEMLETVHLAAAQLSHGSIFSDDCRCRTTRKGRRRFDQMESERVEEILSGRRKKLYMVEYIYPGIYA